MQYISPLHFLSLSDTGQVDKKDLLLARKKMLAELELNDGNSIEINGKEVSKNDITRFFDDLQKADDLAYHVAVFQDKILLRFLEYNILENKDLFAANPLYTDAAFIEWITPFYATSFAEFTVECYRAIRDKEWHTLFSNPLLMSGYDEEVACQSLEKLIQRDVDRVDFLEERPVWEFTKEEVKTICDPRRAAMLAVLPEHRFGPVCDHLAFNIMKLCIKMFNNVDRKWGIKQVKQARSIAASERMREILFDKQVEMESLHSAGSRSLFWKRNFNWRNPRLIFIVLFFVIRAATCNMNSGSSYQNLAPVTFTIDSSRMLSPHADSVDRHVLDSVIKTDNLDSFIKHPKRNPPIGTY